MTTRLLAIVPGRRYAGLLVATACAVVWCALSVFALAEAGRLQRKLDHAQALAAARARLEPALAQPQAPGLRAVLEELLAGTHGFKYLALRDADGAVLAGAGIYESLRLPVSAALQQQVRSLLYAITSRYGEERWQNTGERTLGVLTYAISDSVLREVRDEAVARVQSFGFWGLALGVPLFAGLALALRRWQPPAAALSERLESAKPAITAPVADAAGKKLSERAFGSLDSLQQGVLVVDREGKLKHANPTAEALTGWAAADVQGRPVYTVFHPQDAAGEPLMTPAEICLREGRRYPATELALRARDGSVKPIEVMAAPLADAKGAVDGAVMFFRDVSQRQAAAQAQARSTRRMQSLMDQLLEGVLTTDTAGVIRYANARIERMFGYPRAELTGMTVTKLMPVPFLNSPGIRLDDYVAARRGEKKPRVVGWRRDATTFPVELVVEPLTLEPEDGGYLVMLRDISGERRSDNLSQRLGRLLDNAAEEVYIFDAQSLHFLEVNRSAQRKLGYAADELARLTPLSVAPGLDAQVFHGYLASLRGGAQDSLVYRCEHRCADGSRYPVEVRLNFSRDEEPPVFMAIAIAR